MADYLKGDKSKIPADGLIIVPGVTLTKDNVKQFEADFQKSSLAAKPASTDPQPGDRLRVFHVMRSP